MTDEIEHLVSYRRRTSSGCAIIFMIHGVHVTEFCDPYAALTRAVCIGCRDVLLIVNPDIPIEPQGF